MKLEIIRPYAEQWQQASHGQKSTIIAAVENELGINRSAFYRAIKKLGIDTGRKTRSDKGSTSQSEESLTTLEAMLATGARANGKQIVDTPNAISMLAANGHKFISKSRVNALLRERGTTAKLLNQATPAKLLKSLYPNHVHQLDPSLSLVYYLPTNRQTAKIQRFANDDEFYKNKPENFERVAAFRCWRYVATDHCSGTIRWRYYQAAGENSAAMYDFLMWIWGEHNDDKCPMRGIPKILMMDQGSANTSKAVLNALDTLGVEVITHETGNSRAKGQVENANNLVEKIFESRLIYEPVHSVEELNEKAQYFQNAYNSNTLPNYDSTHSRHGKARYEMWMRALALGKVRDLPEPKICRLLLTAEPVSRKVKNTYMISYRHPVTKQSNDYDCAGCAGVYVGCTVMVAPLVQGKDGEVLVSIEFDGETLKHHLTPVITDEFGFNQNAATIGDLDNITQQPDSHVDQARKQANRKAYEGLTDEQIKKAKKQRKTTPFGGTLDTVSHVADVETPEYMKIRGEQVQTEFDSTPENVISGLALKLAVTELLKRPLTTIEANELAAMGAIPESQIATIVANIQTPTVAPVLQLDNQK